MIFYYICISETQINNNKFSSLMFKMHELLRAFKKTKVAINYLIHILIKINWFHFYNVYDNFISTVSKAI